MKIAVIGAGAIGGLVAGYLKNNGLDVTLVGRADSVKAIKENGLHISGVRGEFNIKIEAFEKLTYQPDLAIFCTKTQDIAEAILANLKFIQDALILTTQNGVRADEIVAKYIPKEKIISSIVMFGSTYLEPAKIVHNFEGPWVIGKIFQKNDTAVMNLSALLNKTFPTVVTEEIKGMKFLKIFVNANNCIPAILGKSMQEAFSDVEVAEISIAIWKEGLEVVNKSGVNLESLPDFPIEKLTKLTSLPTGQAALIFSGIMTGLSKEPLYGSILQSIKRGRTSEIDFINGEFSRLADENNFSAPLNERLTEMVHEVERTHKFFNKEELLSHTKGLVS